MLCNIDGEWICQGTGGGGLGEQATQGKKEFSFLETVQTT